MLQKCFEKRMYLQKEKKKGKRIYLFGDPMFKWLYAVSSTINIDIHLLGFLHILSSQVWGSLRLHNIKFIFIHQLKILGQFMETWLKQGSSTASESSPSREASSPLEGIIEDMQSRIRRLERWLAINTVRTLPFLPIFSFTPTLLFLSLA